MPIRKIMLKKIRIRFPDVSWILAVLVIVILLPFLLLSAPFYLASLKRKNADLQKMYTNFLVEHEGSEIFCYTNRRNSVKLIEELVLPMLPKGTQIVKLEGKEVNTSLNKSCVSYMLYQLSDIGFPNVIKISKGSIIDISLKKKVYSAINQNKEDLLLCIITSGLNGVREHAKNA